MPILQVQDASGHVANHELSRLQPISIGSHPASDIRVQSVAGIHSRISWNANCFEVVAAGDEQLDVNGQLMRHAPLNEGDVLRVGEIDIWFRDADEPKSPRVAGFQPPSKESARPLLQLETIDFSGPVEAADLWERLVELQSPGLVAKLTKISTPQPGLHYSYRCESPFSGDSKLAQFADGSQWRTGCEIRNEGGGAVSSSPLPKFDDDRCEYVHVGGPWIDAMSVISAEERNLLLRAARMADERLPAREGARYEGLAETFNRESNWGEVLEGWTPLQQLDGSTHWMRPKKMSGISAVTNFDGRDVLFVFSRHAGLDDQRSFNKLAAYVHLRHGGRFSSAAEELGRHGYYDDDLQHLRTSLVGQFGGTVDVVGVEKIGRENGIYFLRLGDNRLVKLGEADSVLSPEGCRAAIADQTKILIPLDPEGWAQSANAIIRLARVRDAGSNREDVAGWLKLFVLSCEPFASHSNHPVGSVKWKLQKYTGMGTGKTRNGAFFGEENRLNVHFESLA